MGLISLQTTKHINTPMRAKNKFEFTASTHRDVEFDKWLLLLRSTTSKAQ